MGINYNGAPFDVFVGSFKYNSSPIDEFVQSMLRCWTFNDWVHYVFVPSYIWTEFN